MRSVAGFIVGCVGAAVLAGCQTNSTTGRRDLGGSGLGLSRDQEVQVGATEAPKMIQEFGGEVKSPALRGYIDEVGQKLKNQTETDGPTRAWTYTLLDSDVINAFALPGEKVFISRALADKLTSEAQLAGVLGHETGHVMARHTSKRMAETNAVGIGATILGAIGGAITKNDTVKSGLPTLLGAGGQVYLLNHSREEESEADSLGMRYMTRAGYNPHGQLEVMQVLQRESGTGGSPEWLQTHPLPATRIQRVQQELNTTYAAQSGPQAGNFQDFPDRYRQRYLSVREIEPRPPVKAKKKAQAPMDAQGRTRMLAAINLDDPTGWCAVCRANAVMGAESSMP